MTALDRHLVRVTFGFTRLENDWSWPRPQEGAPRGCQVPILGVRRLATEYLARRGERSPAPLGQRLTILPNRVKPQIAVEPESRNHHERAPRPLR